MNTLSMRTNQMSGELCGDLTTDSQAKRLSGGMPVLATPAAVAAGVAVTAVAFGVGFAVEEANDR
jgi:hypothetical protein